MIHVVVFEKTAFSTPFRGVLPPSGPQISAESGSGHPLSRTRENWLAPNVPRATVLPPHASRPTPYAPRLTLHDARTSGVRSCVDPSPLATACYRPPNWQRPNGARSRRAVPFLVWQRTRLFLRKNQFYLSLQVLDGLSAPESRIQAVPETAEAGAPMNRYLRNCCDCDP
jgi:hypothetical protein